MHEFGLAEGIIATTNANAAGRRVKSIDIEVSELAAVTGEELQFAFDELTRGKALEGVRLNVVVKPAQVTCKSCGYTGRAKFDECDHHSLQCRKCKAPMRIADQKCTVMGIEVD